MDSTDNDDDELFRLLGAILNGRPVDEVIPVLIVAAARAVVEDAGDDPDKLRTAIFKFNRLMAEEALEMFSGRDAHVH
jgi:hypothetical protein